MSTLVKLESRYSSFGHKLVLMDKSVRVDIIVRNRGKCHAELSRRLTGGGVHLEMTFKQLYKGPKISARQLAALWFSYVGKELSPGVLNIMLEMSNTLNICLFGKRSVDALFLLYQVSSVVYAEDFFKELSESLCHQGAYNFSALIKLSQEDGSLGYLPVYCWNLEVAVHEPDASCSYSCFVNVHYSGDDCSEPKTLTDILGVRPKEDQKFLDFCMDLCYVNGFKSTPTAKRSCCGGWKGEMDMCATCPEIKQQEECSDTTSGTKISLASLPEGKELRFTDFSTLDIEKYSEDESYTSSESESED